ncbi:MAG: site-specific DNA-methyltransferase, partial [Acidobacteria bacterium]|nr:site-specific DNA-methyltransferase [Acidobacteriota bacterium]
MKRKPTLRPVLQTKLGRLYQADCLAVLPTLAPESADTVFADPPFNLGKRYGARSSDDQPDAAYLRWCREWLAECVRVLRSGGSLFL